ncbi:hypothetical protein KAH55_08410, partial [bacterium]|nr:hypothetical protein [bacterium]
MYQKIKFSVLLLILTLATAGLTVTNTLIAEQATAGQQFIISQIEIEGNTNTKPFVILKEMQTRPGDVVTWANLESDRKRIASLGIFNYVGMQLLHQEGAVKLRVSVTEQWYVYPYPVIKQIEKSWDKFAFGGGLKYKNFRGRNERLEVEGFWGYQDRLKFEYTIPWLFKNRSI